MGLFARLFKTQPRGTSEKNGDTGSRETAPPDPAIFLQPRNFPLPQPAAAPAPSRGGTPPVLRETAPRREVVFTVDDVLARIPPQFLRAGPPDLRRELRFSVEQFAADIARGRVTVALSAIAAQCPELFHSAIPASDDVAIRLPLQKLLDQISQPDIPRAFLSAASGVRVVEAVVGEVATRSTSDESDESDKDSAPPPETDGGKIHLSLAAIVAGCPAEVFTGERPHVDDGERLAFPFSPIERQLAGGQVEITAQRFITLLPPAYAGCFRVGDGVKIPLPLEEIFRNLPAGATPPPLGDSVKAAPVSEAPATLTVPEPAPGPAEPSASPRPQFMFFSPAPPLPRQLAPPAIFAGLTATDAPVPDAAEPVTPEAASGPTAAPAPSASLLPGIPPLRTIAVSASTDAPALAEPAPRVLQSLAPATPPALPLAGQIASLARPPLVRPLVVLPPPIGATPPASLIGEIISCEAETSSETTADQTAVLEFLSGAPSPEKPAAD